MNNIIDIKTEDIIRSYSSLISSGIAVSLEQYLEVRKYAVCEMNAGYVPSQTVGGGTQVCSGDGRTKKANDENDEKAEIQSSVILQKTESSAKAVKKAQPVTVVKEQPQGNSQIAPQSAKSTENIKDIKNTQEIGNDEFSILKSIKDPWN